MNDDLHLWSGLYAADYKEIAPALDRQYLAA